MMDMRFLLFIKDIVPVMILIIIYIDHRAFKSYERRSLSTAIFNMLVMSGSELVYDYSYKVPELNFLQTLANVVYFIEMAFVPYYWFMYVRATVLPGIITNRALRILYILPVLLMAFAAVMTPATGWLFTVLADGGYLRGPLGNLSGTIPLFYMTLTVLMSFQRSFYEEHYEASATLRMISLCCLIPIVFGYLQLAYGYSVFCLGITMSMLYIHLILKNRVISLDMLTGVNNRSQFFRYASDVINGNTFVRSEKARLILIDLNDFKDINDTYGHIAGDNALRALGRALKTVARQYNCFVARYGGDEFVMIYEGDLNTEMEICKSLDMEVAAETAHGKRFNLTMSYGSAAFEGASGGSIRDIRSIIDIADKAMYADKKQKKQKI